MRKLLVECKFIVPVEVPDSYDAEFNIEENSCPGTGLVWLSLKQLIEHHQQNHTCWACALQGTNKIIKEVKHG